jgi:general secretion pathway protein G
MKFESTNRNSSGFTLIELLIVVAIIGIIAAVAVPNVLSALDKSRQTGTMADIRELSKALNRYMIDNNTYPTTSSVSDMSAMLNPYLPGAKQVDGWRNPLVVISQAGAYTICSNGKDGAGNCETDALGGTQSFNDSITLVSGQWISFPQGGQNQ